MPQLEVSPLSVKFVSLSVPVWSGLQVVVIVGEDLLAPPDHLIRHQGYDDSKERVFDHLKVTVRLVTELVIHFVAQRRPVVDNTAVPLRDIKADLRVDSPGLGSEVSQGEVISGGLVGRLSSHVALVDLSLREADSVEVGHEVAGVESSPGEDSVLSSGDGGGGNVD